MQHRLVLHLRQIVQWDNIPQTLLENQMFRKASKSLHPITNHEFEKCHHFGLFLQNCTSDFIKEDKSEDESNNQIILANNFSM